MNRSSERISMAVFLVSTSPPVASSAALSLAKALAAAATAISAASPTPKLLVLARIAPLPAAPLRRRNYRTRARRLSRLRSPPTAPPGGLHEDPVRPHPGDHRPGRQPIPRRPRHSIARPPPRTLRLRPRPEDHLRNPPTPSGAAAEAMQADLRGGLTVSRNAACNER